jgi:hypothetical protein
VEIRFVDFHISTRDLALKPPMRMTAGPWPKPGLLLFAFLVIGSITRSMLFASVGRRNLL